MAWEPDYIETADLKSHRRIENDVDDNELALAITAASRAVDHETGRQFGVTASTESREFEGEWSRRRGLYRVRIDDVMTAAGFVVTVSGSTVTSANYRLEPRNAPEHGRPWEVIYLKSITRDNLGIGPGTVDIVATWGWTAVPDTIKEATAIQAARFYKRRDAPFGIAGSPEMGSEMRLLAMVDPDVAAMVRPYRRDHPKVV